jgi:hypothetical protein
MVELLGINPDGRYRVAGEEAILQSLVRHCWPYEARAGAEAAALREAGRALERWLSRGLPCRREGDKRLFDLCQVINFMTWIGLSHGDPVYEQCAVRTSRRVVSEFPDAAPTAAGAGVYAPRRFLVRLRREFNLEGAAPDRVVRLRVPVPFEDRTQRDVSVELVEPAPGTLPVTQAPGRLEIRYPRRRGAERVAVEVRVRFTAYRKAYAVDPDRLVPWNRSTPEYALYTRRSEGLIQITEPIIRLAESVSGSAKNAWEAVCAFWRFVFEHMKVGYIHHDELDRADPLSSLLQRGWSDCYTSAALLAALCRARGIPARLVDGLLIFPSVPSDHFWLEVLLPPYGWVPLDLLSWAIAGGRPDQEPWSQFYLGRLDYRMKTQYLPHLVLGSPGVRIPPDWYTITRLTPMGTETAYHSLRPPHLLYTDQIQVCYEPTEGGRPVARP